MWLVQLQIATGSASEVQSEIRENEACVLFFLHRWTSLHHICICLSIQRVVISYWLPLGILTNSSLKLGQETPRPRHTHLCRGLLLA